MKVFSWISARRECPLRWDLRKVGWLSPGGLAPVGSGINLLDGLPGLCQWRRIDPSARIPRNRLVVIGNLPSLLRSDLLRWGIADVLADDVELAELNQRLIRLIPGENNLARLREVGRMTMDLFHRDAMVGGRWLALHPREFALLWRLSDTPGLCVTRRQLLRDVWRLQHVPETNSLEVHVCRLRAKLSTAGLERLIVTDPAGGYRLDVKEQPLFFRSRQSSGLDSHLRMSDVTAKVGEPEKG